MADLICPTCKTGALRRVTTTVRAVPLREPTREGVAWDHGLPDLEESTVYTCPVCWMDWHTAEALEAALR